MGKRKKERKTYVNIRKYQKMYTTLSARAQHFPQHDLWARDALVEPDVYSIYSLILPCEVTFFVTFGSKLSVNVPQIVT